VTRNRIVLLAAAVGAAAVVAVVLILVATGGSNPSSTTTSVAAAQSTPTVKQLFAGIPQHGDTLGKASAPATLVVYEDPQCPYCRAWNLETLPTVIDQYVRTGRIKLDYRGIEIIGPDSVKGLRAIYAAGEQNKLWNFADALYVHQGEENSGWITNGVILRAAAEAGANGKAILADMGSAAVGAAVAKARSEATADQVQGTPTFILQKPPALAQQLALTALDPATFVAALSAALQG
jgi:protein-disulfide isomerase